jgi:zeta-carotene desaturase
VGVDFSTFADLAITSPTDYYKEGEGSLLQLVLTPGDPFIKESNEAIVSIPWHRCAKFCPLPVI